MLIRFLSCIIFLSSSLGSSSVYACLTCPVSTGVEKLKLPDGEIIIHPNVSKQCIKDAKAGKDVTCFPHATLVLTRNGKSYDFTKLINKWDEFHSYFVKIRKDKYLADLNNDNRDEIAILPMLSGGGAHVLDAYIYTIMDDELKYYGKGRFLWEIGDYVKFGCPKCSRWDLKSCETCY